MGIIGNTGNLLATAEEIDGIDGWIMGLLWARWVRWVYVEMGQTD